MAVIQKIRDKYAKLAGFVIALALVGFILMDAASGRLGDLLGRDTSVAKVNGEKIDYKDYTQRIQEYESLYELMGNNKIDDNTRAQIHDQVLREMIYEKMVQEQLDDLGIQVTKEEEREMFSGTNPDPMVLQFPYFRNPETGQFDPQILAQFEGNKLDLSNPQAQTAMLQWQDLKNYVRRNRLIQKYNSLFTAAVYTPKFMLDRQLKDQNYTGSIRYVKIPFTSVNDNEVKVTDADLNDYIKKHAAQYTIDEPTRSIEYVSFDVNPSAGDSAVVLNEMNRIKEEFQNTSDAESFVNRNSEEQFQDRYVFKKSFMSAYSDSIMNLPVSSVFGPYYENGAYRFVKVLDKKSLPDSAKAQHILIAVTQTRDDSSAKKTADSLMAAIQNGASFDSLASRFSDDPGSKAEGGDLGYFAYGAMVPEFNDAVFLGKTGDLKVVKSQYGYHIIKVNDQKDFSEAAKLAIITKQLAPSSETENMAFAKANEFAGKNNSSKAFDEAIKAQGLNRMQAQNVKVNDFIIPGIGSSREVIRWIYDAKKGDVSPVFNVDNRYIIAKLSEVQDKGLMKLDESNRPMIENLVKAQKKADIIAQKYKSMNSVDAIAQAATQPVQTADSFNAASSYLPNLGYEPKVVGYTFFDGFKPATTSPAIKGQDGVYFISLVSRHQNPVNEQDPMIQQQRMMETMQLKNALGSMLQESMKRDAKIKYNAEMLY